MKLPTDLIQKMQGDYVSLKYKDGMFAFSNIDEETLGVFIRSFLDWAKAKKLIDSDGNLDTTSIQDW